MDTMHNKKGELRRENPQRLNFRVEAKQLNDDGGIWTVWNRNREGDVAQFPIGRRPASPSAFRKVAFDRVILRISDAQKYVELGFWEDGMRRTIIGYNPCRNPWSGSRTFFSQQVTVLQQQKVPSRGFVGNCSEGKDVHILPDEPPFAIESLDLERLTPVRMEHVDFATMERTSTKIRSERAKRDAFELVLSAFHGEESVVLQNEVCLAAVEDTTLLGYKWRNGSFQVIALHCDTNTGKALGVSCYILR